MKIIIDSREQLPLKFKKRGEIRDVIRRKLNVGDYSIAGYEHLISIERKNPSDLFGTLGSGHSRFRKEMERARDYDYFGILCEASYSVIRDKEFQGSHYTKMRGTTVLDIAYTLKLKYGIDLIFCNGPKEAASIIYKIFKNYLKLKRIGHVFIQRRII